MEYFTLNRLITALSLCLALSACGGNNDKTTPVPPSPPVTAPEDDCNSELQHSSCVLEPEQSLTVNINDSQDVDVIAMTISVAGIYQVTFSSELSISATLSDALGEAFILDINKSDSEDYVTFVPLQSGDYIFVVQASDTITGSVTLSASLAPDTDEDGLADAQELLLGTDPESIDTDSDGLQDGKEYFETGTSPVLADSDGDSFSDFEELWLNTSPLDTSNYPIVNGWSFDGHFVHLDPFSINSPPFINGEVEPMGESRFFAVEMPTEPPQLRWTKNIDALNTLVSNEQMIVVRGIAGITAIDSLTGDNLWTDNQLTQAGLHRIFEGHVYVSNAEQSGLHKLYGNYTAAPILETITEPGYADLNSLVVTDDGMTYLLSGHLLIKLDQQGNRLWQYPIQHESRNKPGLVLRGDKIYLINNGLKALDKESGEPDATFKIIDATGGDIIPLRLFAGSSNNLIMVSQQEIINYSISENTIAWRTPLLVDNVYTYHSLQTKLVPTVRFGELFLHNDSKVISLSEVNGSEIWNWQLPDNEDSIEALLSTRNHLIVDTENSVYVLNLTTRTLQYTIDAIGKVYIANNGNLYINDRSNDTLTAYNIETDTDGDGLPDWWERLHHLHIANTDDALADADEDGLDNLSEFNHNTHPLKADSDEDGLNDNQEINTYFTHPFIADTDGDTIPDGQEVSLGTSPISIDTDNDNLPDNWEITHNLDPLNNDSSADPDNDGLTNIAEFLYGTLPDNADSNGNGIPDNEEPGLQLPPSDKDSDHDSLPDNWELLYGLDPNSASDANLDPDNDGYLNFEEFYLATNPLITDSFPKQTGWTTRAANGSRNNFVNEKVTYQSITKYADLPALTDAKLLSYGDFLIQFNQQLISVWQISSKEHAWQFTPLNNEDIQDVIINANYAIVSTTLEDSGQVTVLDLESGQLQHQFSAQLNGMSTQDNLLYAENSTSVYNLDGSTAFVIDSETDSLLVNESNIYALDSPHRIHIHNRLNGELLRTIELPWNPTYHHVGGGDVDTFHHASPLHIDSKGHLWMSVGDNEFDWQWIAPNISNSEFITIADNKDYLQFKASVYGSHYAKPYDTTIEDGTSLQNFILIPNLRQAIATRNSVFTRTDKTQLLDRDTESVLWETDINGDMIFSNHHLFINEGESIHIFKFE